MKKNILALLVAVICIITSGCATENRVIALIEKEEYAKAQEVYSATIGGSYEKVLELEHSIDAYIADMIDKYNNGKVSYDEARESIFRIEASGLYDYFLVNDAYMSLQTFYQSKQAYEMGLANMDAGDYESAMTQFSFVNTADTCYDSACEKAEEAKTAFLNAVIAQAEDAFDDTDYLRGYENAISCLADAEDKMYDFIIYMDDAAFQLIYDKRAELTNEFTEAAIADAKDVFSNGENYEGAISLLTDAYNYTYGDDAMLYTELCKYTDAYIENAVAEAQQIYDENRDYEAAASHLQSVIGVVGENETLRSEIEKYASYAPVLLTSLDPIQKGKWLSIGTDIKKVYTDVSNNVYDSQTVIAPKRSSYRDKTEDDSYVSYYLNSEYTTLTGVLYRPYDSLSCTSVWQKTPVIKIYGDGILLYEAPGIDQNTFDPISLSINVTGVRELKIVNFGVWNGNDSGNIYFASYHPMVCLAEMYLNK